MRLSPMLAPVLTVSLVVSAAAQTPAPVYGAATPQEAVAGVKAAAAAHDFGGAMKFVSPAGRKTLSQDMLIGMMVMLAFSDPSDPMPGGPKKSAKELDTEKKNYASAVAAVKGMLKPHGLDSLLTMKAMNESTQKFLDTALDKTDTVVLIGSGVATMDKIGPLLGMKKDEKPNEVPFEIGAVTGYKISGDKATAQNGKETIELVKVDGRWYLTPPVEKKTSGKS
jgi:hypothetical protein